MHIGAKLGIAAVAGLAGGVAIGSLLDSDKRSTGAGAAMLGLGMGSVIVNARSAVNAAHAGVRGLAIATVASGAALAGLGIMHLAGSGSSRTTPIPHLPIPPSPPTGTTSATPDGHTLDEVVERGRADDVPTPHAGGTSIIEEESETYGPDGEWLGSDHGTLER